jgi:hypothetical protein
MHPMIDFCVVCGAYWDCEHRQAPRPVRYSSPPLARPYQMSPDSPYGRQINQMYDDVMAELDERPQPPPETPRS